MRTVLRVLILCCALALTSCDSRRTPTPAPNPGPASGSSALPPLRQLAPRCRIAVGTAVASGPLMGEPRYGDTLRREFDTVTPENDMKWGPIHPQRSQYAFDNADAIVAFAAANDMNVHGHTLVWHNQNPAWLTGGTFTRDEMIDILHDHVFTVVRRFAGRYVKTWDVVNEAVNDDGTLRRTLWLDRIGPEYIDLAFRFANEADPTAKLLYNDYGDETINAKSTAIHNLVSGLRARGVPIHGVGLQMHLTDTGTNVPSLVQNMERFAALGLEISITEMDVRLRLPATAAMLMTQAVIYGDVLDACLKQPACKAFHTWGFSDAHSWIPGAFPGSGSALIFDDSYGAKPAYETLARRMNECR